MISRAIIDAAISDAKLRMPAESCGLIVSKHRRSLYYPCRNTARGNEHFIIHEDDYIKASEDGEIIAIVHSHPNTNPAPSQADLLGIERTNLPWLIVNPRTGAYTLNNPNGYKLPLMGREFVSGVIDCYTLIKDYYDYELSIKLPDFEREDEWWLKNQNLYRDHFEEAGFSIVPIDSLKEHDVIIMRIGAPVDNHGGVYLGSNRILQHVAKQLSSRDIYGGYWRKATTMILRHKDFL